MLRVSAWLRWWMFGAVTGIALLWVMIFDAIVFPLALVVLVVVVLRSPERAALGGGALIVNEQAIAMGLYVAVGIALTAYAASRRRWLPASADPSAAVPTRR